MRPAIVASVLLLFLYSASGTAGKAEKQAAAIAKLRLFEADGTPRFSLHYACRGNNAGETAQCTTVANALEAWTQPRKLRAREVAVDGPVRKLRGLPEGAVRADEPVPAYRIWTRFSPVVIASSWGMDRDLGGYDPPKAGCHAWLEIIDSANGNVVFDEDFHEQTRIEQRADVTPYVKAVVLILLARLTPPAS